MLLVLNFVLAVIWMALQRSFALVDFAVGFGLGFGIIAMTQPVLRELRPIDTTPHDNRPGSYPMQTWRAFSLFFYALWSILKSSIEVALIVIRPKLDIQPGIVAIPLDVRSDLGITLLANLITLTPGTVSLDMSTDRRTLYVHSINIDDPDALRDDIKQNFERRVMELFP
jgi:multicomponent Na+:H+ antiporter subunit E